jgi:hypothetical protein
LFEKFLPALLCAFFKPFALCLHLTFQQETAKGEKKQTNLAVERGVNVMKINFLLLFALAFMLVIAGGAMAYEEMGPASSHPEQGYEEWAPATASPEYGREELEYEYLIPEQGTEEMTPATSDREQGYDEMEPSGSISEREESVSEGFDY